MINRLCNRLKQTVKHRTRRSQVRINHREIEHWPPFKQELMLNLLEAVQVVVTEQLL
jgi:hypothetical protein